MSCVDDVVVIEGGLVQVDTDQSDADTFSLCTACGDVFIFHVSINTAFYSDTCKMFTCNL